MGSEGEGCRASSPWGVPENSRDWINFNDKLENIRVRNPSYSGRPGICWAFFSFLFFFQEDMLVSCWWFFELPYIGGGVIKGRLLKVSSIDLFHS